eukprot:1149407-Pelagomonas_calceolata.AAC.3
MSNQTNGDLVGCRPSVQACASLFCKQPVQWPPPPVLHCLDCKTGWCVVFVEDLTAWQWSSVASLMPTFMNAEFTPVGISPAARADIDCA